MRKVLALVLLLVCVQVFAQTNPITGITISLPANPDANTANWSSGAAAFAITASSRLTNGKMDTRVTESKILLTIKSGGAKICGAFTGNTAPVANFTTVVKTWSGNNAVSLLGADCVLPAGDYELCVQFFGAGAAGTTTLSEEKCKTFSIRANEQQQTYPITGINILLPQIADANTANWQTGAGMLSVTASTKMNNGKIDARVTDSKILVTVKKSGSKICGNYTGSTAPSANFNSVVKTWIGNNAVSLLGSDCVLPPGDYELCVQFFGAGAAGTVPLSEEKCKAFTVRATEQQNYQPPQATAPANESQLSETEIKQPITFRWIPVVPRPRDPVTYRLRIWQLMEGQNATQAIKANQPVITKDVDNITQAVVTNLVNSPCLPPYLCEFAWNVQALNKEEKPLGGNNGMSETFVLTVKSDVPVKDPGGDGTAVLKTDDKITLVSPMMELKQGDNRPLFQWTIANTTPVSSYSIKVVEVLKNQDPQEAFRLNVPILESKGIKDISFKYPSSSQAIDTGKMYVWAVSAWDGNGKQLAQSGVAGFFLPGFPFFPLPCNFSINPITSLNVCQGASSVSMHASASQGGYFYSVTNSSGAMVANGINSPANLVINLAVPSATGTYTYTLTCSKFVWFPYFHMCYSSRPFTITVSPLLTPTIDNAEICNNGQSTLRLLPLLPTGASLSWEYSDISNSGPWTTSPMSGTPSNTNSITTICSSTPGFVRRYYRPILTGSVGLTCLSTPTISIKVWCPTVTGTISASPLTACTNTNTNVTLQYTGGVYTSLLWHGYGIPASGAIGSGVNHLLTINSVPPGTYIYTATIQNGTCSSINSPVTVIIEAPLPPPVVTTNKSIVCPNDDATLTVAPWPQPAGAIMTWQYQINCAGPWTTASGAVGGSQNTNNIGNLGPYPTPPTNSLCWKVVLTSASGICTPVSSATVPITIVQPPCCATISTAGTNPKCPGTAILLTSQFPPGCNSTGITRKWYLNGVFTGNTAATLSAITPGNYTVVTYSSCASGICDSCTSQPFEVIDCHNTLTIAGDCSRVKTDPPTSLCATVSSTGAPCSGTPVYTWSGAGIISNNGACITVAPTVTSTYRVTVTGMGCSPVPLITSWTVKVCQPQ